MIKKYFLIIEALLQNEEGLTRDEINDMLKREGESTYRRQHFFPAINQIYARTGLKIQSHNCGKNVWRYRINREQLEDYDSQQLIGNLITNMMQADFLREFRDLGKKIQPVIIARGTEYLRPIGTAIRLNRKLSITYQKFGEPAYDAIIHPYCLKVFGGRWYLFAFKEHSEHPDAKVQCFSLDRLKAIDVTLDTFEPDLTFDPLEYFRDAFGIWVDPEGHPAKDVIVSCIPKVANYLRSLPLHHTQKEIEMEPSSDNPELTCHFSFHISVTPDFVSELQKWGDGIKLTILN